MMGSSGRCSPYPDLADDPDIKKFIKGACDF